MKQTKMNLSNWGNYPVSSCFAARPEQYAQIGSIDEVTIARGLGRNYSDAALNTDHHVILMERLNRLRSFDEKTGILVAEAGVSLEEILQIFIPRGWFIPVTPGTKFVTLGGCIASDVHGKNHPSQGSFSRCVQEMEIITADGVRTRCSPSTSSELFWATVGGMGLTGIISEVTIQMVPINTAYLKAQYHSAKTFDELLEHYEKAFLTSEHVVAWIDCLATGAEFGRGIVMEASHATLQDLPSTLSDPLQMPKRRKIKVPFYMPSFAINEWSIKKFNNLYYKQMCKKPADEIVDFESFLYPLDSLLDWNKCYGKRGFIQYQFVIPTEQSRQTMRQILEMVTTSGYPGCLGVLKRFGQQGNGYLSFAMPGDTLAIDFPIIDKGLFAFLDQLDKIVLDAGGRVSLSKDMRMSAQSFHLMYPRLTEWQNIKASVDPLNRLQSDLSRRLQMENKLWQKQS